MDYKARTIGHQYSIANSIKRATRKLNQRKQLMLKQGDTISAKRCDVRLERLKKDGVQTSS